MLDENARTRRRRGRHLADVAHAFLRIPTEELGRVGDLAAAVGQRLAVLQRDELREPLGVGHDQLVGLAQDLGALTRLLSRPAGERRLRRIDGRLRVLDRGARHVADLLLGRRIDDVEARAVGGLLPLAADPQIGGNIGKQIVVGGARFGHLKGPQLGFSVAAASGAQSTSSGKVCTSNGGALTGSLSLKVAASCHLPASNANTSSVLASGSTYQQ